MRGPALIVGLGNPGKEYRGTRHNVGYRVVEAVARDLDLAFGPDDGVSREAAGPGPGGPVSLLQPLTYMNRSGRAVARWLARRADPEGPEPRLLVVCDDLNLPLGAVRLRARGGSGGQKGLADILETLGTEDVCRLRLGVAPPGGGVDPADWADFVLEEFAAAEREAAEDMIAHAAAACRDWLAHGTEHAASRFNRRPEPPEEGGSA